MPAKTAAKPKAKRKRPGRKPAGDSVTLHPLFNEIVDMLRQGFAPPSIHAILDKKYRLQIGARVHEIAPLPSVRTIYRYLGNHRDQIQPNPNTKLEEALEQPEGVYQQVDMLRSLEVAYMHAEDRVTRCIALEASTDDGGGGQPLDITDGAYKTMHECGERLLKLQRELGIVGPPGVGEPRPIKTELRKDRAKFSPERCSAIVAYIEAGNYRSIAAVACGVGAGSLRKWLKQGAKDIVADKNTPKAAFYLDVAMAEAVAEVNDIQLIGDAAVGGNWQAAAWRRERKDPARWGRRGTTTLDIRRGSREVAEKYGLDPDEMENIGKDIAAKAAEKEGAA